MVNIVSTYAPQTGCPEEDKQQFFEELEELMKGIPREEVGTDLNGYVGSDRSGFERHQGPFGLGIRNEGGSRILETSEELYLLIVNSWF